MTKIYIDTNIFASFYHSMSDNYSVLDELNQHVNSLIFTKQTLNEFYRTRLNVIKQAKDSLNNNMKIKSFSSSILNKNNDFIELNSIKNTFSRKLADVNSYLDSILDIKNDSFADKFYLLTNNNNVSVFPVTKTNIEAAKDRKALGNPPTSSNKYTIGDEVIWESILENIDDDLIIVTRDKTYIENIHILQEEFIKVTGKKLISVEQNISSALRKIGEIPSNSLIVEEENIRDDANVKLGASFCPICNHSLVTIVNDEGNGKITIGVQCENCMYTNWVF
ncbi:hypothetical protein F8S13_11970 [Chloroflexia bacterium SDU3-3]|nr:hypothetical protein F8S13_11970 [Chloroflexia bacterium SDU3-3]